MDNTVNFLHTGTIGDVYASFPAMREYWRQTGKKISLFLEKDHPAKYYEGAVHPTKNSDGDIVMLNESMINMMIPLINEQPFIGSVKMWENEPIAIDLNWIRDTFVNLPNGCISRWYFYVYPDLACDLSEKWMVVPPAEKDLAKDKIIITRSERYRNDQVKYGFLKPYEDDLVFAGTMREYNNFCMSHDLNVRKLTVNNFLELAQAIQQSRFHISNQTMAFQISQGIKHPRMVELCSYAPNVIPYGPDAYDFYSQRALEYYFHKLNKKAPEMEAFLDKVKADENAKAI